jgi:hypothetical protein
VTRRLNDNGRQVLVACESNVCGDIRIHRFLDGLDGCAFTYAPIGEWEAYDWSAIDAFVIHRDINPSGVQMHRKLKARGRYTIYEIDDLLWDLPSYSQSRFPRQQKQAILDHLTLASAVTTSTEVLAAYIRPYNANVCVIKNPPPVVPRFSKRLLLANTDAIKAGTFKDAFLAALRTVLERHAAELILVGDVRPHEIAVDPARVRYFPPLRYDAYLTLLAALAPTVDLALVPLEPSSYALCKSDIKALDFAATGLVGLYSNVPPYSELISHGDNGLLADNTEQAWTAAIDGALASPSQLSAMRGAVATALTHNDRGQRGKRAWSDLLDAPAATATGG